MEVRCLVKFPIEPSMRKMEGSCRLQWATFPKTFRRVSVQQIFQDHLREFYILLWAKMHFLFWILPKLYNHSVNFFMQHGIVWAAGNVWIKLCVQNASENAAPTSLDSVCRNDCSDRNPLKGFLWCCVQLKQTAEWQMKAVRKCN